MEPKTKAEREEKFLSLENAEIQRVVSDIEHTLDANYGKTLRVNMEKHNDRVVKYIKELYTSKGYTVTRNHGSDQRDGDWDYLEIT